MKEPVAGNEPLTTGYTCKNLRAESFRVYNQLWGPICAEGTPSKPDLNISALYFCGRKKIQVYVLLKDLMWVSSTQSRRFVHTSTHFWGFWKPTCLQLDSESGSSFLREWAAGGGGLPNSSTANLTSPGPLSDTMKRRPIGITAYERICQACFFKEIKIKLSRQEWQMVLQNNGRYPHRSRLLRCGVFHSFLHASLKPQRRKQFRSIEYTQNRTSSPFCK